MKHLKTFNLFESTMFDLEGGMDRVRASVDFDENHYDVAKALLDGNWQKTKPGRYAMKRADLLSRAKSGTVEEFLPHTALLCAILDGKSMDANEYTGQMGEPRMCFKNAILASEADPGYDVVVGMVLSKDDISGPYPYHDGSVAVHAFLRSGGAVFDPTLRDHRSHIYYPLEVVEGKYLHQHDLAIRAWKVANAYERAVKEYTGGKK